MKRRPSFSTLAALAFMALGIALRLWYYLDARSLFIDEANLALNISELGYGGFFQPLRYQQYAPPLFLALAKMAVQLLGNHEYALRLWPLAGSLAMLVTFYILVRELAPAPPVHWFPIALLALSPFLLRYSTEVKQYSTDAAIALGMVLLALRTPAGALRRRHYRLWAAVGAVAPWLSMPAVFVLCGVGAYYGYQLRQQKRWKAIGSFCLVGTAWAASFLALYFSLLRGSAGEAALQDYHAPYFFPLRLWEAEAWRQLGQICLGLLKPALGYTVASLVIGIVLLLWGGWRLARRRADVFLLLVGPILAGAAASACQQFSLIPRVALFMMPLLLLLAARGASEAWNAGGRYARGALLLLLALAAAPFLDSAGLLGRSTEIENLKGVLLQARAEGKEGPAYIDFEAAPAYRYYSEQHCQKEAFTLPGAILLSWDDRLDELLKRQPAAPGFWLVFSHLLSSEPRERMSRMRNMAGETAKEKLQIEKVGAAGYRFENLIAAPDGIGS